MSAPAINRLAIFLKSSQLCFVSDGSQVSFIPSALPTALLSSVRFFEAAGSAAAF